MKHKLKKLWPYLLILLFIISTISIIINKHDEYKGYEALINNSYYRNEMYDRTPYHEGKFISRFSEDKNIDVEDYISSFDKLVTNINNTNKNLNSNWCFDNSHIFGNYSYRLEIKINTNIELNDEEIFNILKSVRKHIESNKIYNDINVTITLNNLTPNQYDKFGNIIYNTYDFYNIDKMNFENMDSDSLNKFL